MSPYATGGGGVTFERKVAVQYLAHLLVGDGAGELGDGRYAQSVAFQQAPDYPVDDLVVNAASPDELQPPLVLALAVRRSPDLVASDQSTRKLIREFVRAVVNTPTDGREHRLSTGRLQAFLGRPLGELDLRMVCIDGKVFRDHCMVVALGIDTQGRKHVLGLREGATENRCRHHRPVERPGDARTADGPDVAVRRRWRSRAAAGHHRCLRFSRRGATLPSPQI